MKLPNNTPQGTHLRHEDESSTIEVHLTPPSMASGRIQQRIDPRLQQEAEAILETQGIKPSQAIILFYTEVKRAGGLPFRPSPVHPSEIPNARLRKDLRQAAQGRGIRTFKTKDAFFNSLQSGSA
jgi:addiction module RelB/DinJ family antitoxin